MRYRWLAHWFSVATLIGGFAVTAVISRNLSKQEQLRVQSVFRERAENASLAIEENLESYKNAVRGLAGLFAANSSLERDFFDSQMRPYCDTLRGVQALEWVPAVDAVEVDRLTGEAIADGYESFHFRQWNGGGEWGTSSAAEGTVVTPVRFVYPLESNERALGIDLASNPSRREALTKAAKTLSIVATEPISLAQVSENATGFLLVHSVANAPIDATSIDDPFSDVRGFAVGVFRVDDIVVSALGNRNTRDLSLAISDVTGTPSGPGTSLYSSQEAESLIDSDVVERVIHVGGRRWLLRWAQSPGPSGDETGTIWPITFSLGSALTLLLAALAFQFETRTARVESEVDAQTAALRGANRNLGRTQFVIDSSRDAIYWVREDARFIYVNDGACQMLGFERDELLQQRVVDIDPEWPDDRWREHWARMQRERFMQLETKHVGADGSSRWVRMDIHFYEYDGEEFIVGIATDVTSIRKVEKLVGLAFESSPTAILMFDVAGKITMANGAAANLFGYDDGSIEASHATELLPDIVVPEQTDSGGDDLDDVQHPLRKGRDAEALHANGSRFPVEVALTVVETPDGRQVVASVTDLTEKRHNEASLLSTNELLEKTSALAKVGGWSLHLESGDIVWSDEVCRIHEVPRGYVPELESAINFYAEQYRGQIESLVARCAQDGEPWDIQAEILTARGRQLWVRAIGEAKYKDGAIVGLAGTFQDIDASKRAEIALQKSEEQLDIALTNANIGLWDWDVASNAVYFSRTAQTQLGYAPDGSWIHFDDWRSRLHPDDVDLALKRVEDYLEGRLDEYVSSFRLRHRDGTYRTIRAQGRCSFDGRGRPQRMTGVHVDITDLVEAERALSERSADLARAVASLEQSNEALKHFAYVASHDLQTPLRGISAYAGFLEDDFGEQISEDASSYLSKIKDGCERMQRLIRDLLVYSRVTSQSFPMAKVDLGAIANETASLLTATGDYPNCEINVGELPVCSGNESQLGRVLQNLIGNGLKYQDGNSPRVDISAEQKAGFHVISVRDNGIGIAEDKQEKVFEIFQRLHNHREYEGSGIGLAVCQTIIERHGGKIWVESSPGEGSTFLFTLPIGQPSS